MNYFKRELTPGEKMFTHLGGEMSMTFIGQVEGLISPDVLQQALRLVQKRHLLLQVHISKSDEGVFFESGDAQDIPLQVIDKQSDNQWVAIAETEVNQTLCVNIGPLCRVIFLRSTEPGSTSEIIVTMHHAICDAISGLNFIDQVLSYCQQIEAGESIADVVTLAALPPLKDLFNASSVNQGTGENPQEESNWDAQSAWGGPQPLISEFFEGQAALSDCHTRFLTRQLSREMTIQLKTRSKEEGTTVHAALCAAMLFGAAAIARADAPVYLSCGSSVSLRNYCEPKVQDDHLSCISDGVTHTYSVGKTTSFWDLARESKSNLVQSMSNGSWIVNSADFFESMENMPQLEQLRAELERLMGRYASVLIANAGQAKFSGQYGTIQLKGLYFPISVHLAGPCFALNVVTLDDQMFCTFPYVVPMFSDETMAMFADSVMAILHQSCVPQAFELGGFDGVAHEKTPQLTA
ncbi:hypothetical protein IQ268_25485 [Oculatella sp. LEGE 06141]|uniref:phthiocerol/phthiodiolone dimycocerosyl transferase family protein n=1 Tax=Oculatella sp. LEGE 06141 TaxID=1828648 RepID=UPI001882CB54|nr:condensation domain-containing protein [Oculatella sp. LEGE 06141]MBE9181926.1 hypothetical protein [Oculatella sp. LEGE 06141]